MHEKTDIDPALKEGFQRCGCQLVERLLPRIVLIPEEEEEESIASLVKFADEKRLRICPTGTGSSFPANYEPPEDLIFILTTRMNQLLELKLLDAIAVMEPGILASELAKRLEGTDLDLPTCIAEYPGTMGGALLGPDPKNERHAHVRRRLLSLQLVDPKGRVLYFGSNAIKNVAGYDYWSFLIGTGSRFGVVTRLTLNLEKMPPLDAIPHVESQCESERNAGQWIVANLCKGLDPDGIFVR